MFLSLVKFYFKKLVKIYVLKLIEYINEIIIFNAFESHLSFCKSHENSHINSDDLR